MATRYLVTSALPYINGIKHLGNLIGSMLPADVYARFRRACGHEVLFICATDEHGTPAELAAHAAGLTPAEYCARMHQRQADIYRQMDLSFDHFGRTSDPHNHRLTQAIYRDLAARGFVETRAQTMLWSHDDQRFLPDRYVEGTCPRCGYTRARGDQCEACASLLDPSDLLDARSALSGSTQLEPRSSQHVFLRLGALEGQVAAWVERAGAAWGEMTLSIAHKWLAEGLKDRCISRDLTWGVPVPEPHMAGKVFYVWFDAPVGYISATCEWAAARQDPDAWRRWWVVPPAGGADDADVVEYSQFMAKDNVPFHTVMFPAMILGAGGTFRMPDRIKGFNWLNYYGGKFSTSQSRGVFLDDALALFPADVWRYALLVQAPEGRDGAFTWEEFALRVNKDLNDTLGNFVHRVLRFVETRMGPEVPAGGAPGEAEQALAGALAARAQAIAGHLGAQEFRKATEQLRDAFGEGNLYIDRGAPWKVFKSDPHHAAMQLRTCINVMAVYAELMAPFMPATAGRLRQALHVTRPSPAVWRGEVDLTALSPGHPLAVPPPLFSKIDAEATVALKSRFGGEDVPAGAQEAS